MSLPRHHIGYSIEEYLAIDRASEERYEYLDGEIYAMAGESPAHGDICTNLTWLLHGQLKDGPCHVFSKDTKVRSGPDPMPGRKQGLFSYPDVVVVCEEMRFHDDHQDVLLNPTVIIEVASPHTEAFDRGEKWSRYQTWLPQLTKYLMVSQVRPRIEHFKREPGGEWVYSAANDLEATVHLKSINCTLKLTDVYSRVVFPEPDPEKADDSLENLFTTRKASLQ
jgi:Uma2 family endonuclease